MPQQSADNGQAKSATGHEAGEGVPKIVQANPIESGALRHSLRWTFQIGNGEFNMIILVNLAVPQ
jgi:hypothetical protein